MRVIALDLSGEGAVSDYKKLLQGFIWKERGHAPDRQRAAAMTDVDDAAADVLEERDVMRDRVAVRQDPRGIRQLELEQAGHIVPPPEVEPDPEQLSTRTPRSSALLATP